MLIYLGDTRWLLQCTAVNIGFNPGRAQHTNADIRVRQFLLETLCIPDHGELSGVIRTHIWVSV